MTHEEFEAAMAEAQESIRRRMSDLARELRQEPKPACDALGSETDEERRLRRQAEEGIQSVRSDTPEANAVRQRMREAFFQGKAAALDKTELAEREKEEFTQLRSDLLYQILSRRGGGTTLTAAEKRALQMESRALAMILVFAQLYADVPRRLLFEWGRWLFEECWAETERRLRQELVEELIKNDPVDVLQRLRQRPKGAPPTEAEIRALTAVMQR
jgi:hypothetical protein